MSDIYHNGEMYTQKKKTDKKFRQLEIERDALQNELNKAYKNLAFYRCCALSGETPREGSEPFPDLKSA